MNREETLHQFFSGFGLPAYRETAVPDNMEYPYLTYDAPWGSWGDENCPVTVNLWFYTEEEAAPDRSARAVGEAVGPGGVMLPYDGGGVWLRRASPWCRSLRDPEDRLVKRRLISLTAEYVGP